MDDLFKQILVATDSGLYFLALTGALIIPDVCGALASPTGEASGRTYMNWFDTFAADRFRGMLDGDTCYRLRCSLLHQGTTQHPKSPYSRVLFVEPDDATNIVVHLNVVHDALNLDVRRFSFDMVEAALDWQSAAVGTEPYATNIGRFLQRHSTGFGGVVGRPVIT